VTTTRSVHSTFAEANTLWESGKRTDAAAKYRSLIPLDVPLLEKSDRTTLYARMIDYDADEPTPMRQSSLSISALPMGSSRRCNRQGPWRY